MEKSNYYLMLTVFTYDLLKERCIDDFINIFYFFIINFI